MALLGNSKIGIRAGVVDTFYPLSNRAPAVALRESPRVAVDVAEKADEPEDEERILCARCLQVIGRPADRIEVNGSHRHAFANPHGFVYEIGCFRAVTGCGIVGEASTEFTWFWGYAWRVVVCGGCLAHLGWAFTADSGDGFYGLILDHIVLFP